MTMLIGSQLVLRKPECWTAPAEHFGAASIPVGFGECNGTCTTDPILDPLSK
jgi:hypothetical protein